MVDKARRPYLDLDDYEARKPGTPQGPLETSVVRMPSRYLSTSLDRESEFEKPYLGTSPRKQHFDWNLPDWPGDWGLPDWTTGGGEGLPADRTCPHCALAFDPIYDCTEDWGEAHAMIYCSFQPGTDCPDCTMQITAVAGAIRDIQPGTWSRHVGELKWTNPFGWRADLPQNQGKQTLAPTSGTMSLKVQVDPTVSTHILKAEMIDGAGNYCEAFLNVNCCDCANPPTALSIVSYDSTIDPDGTPAFVTVTGGCGPYKYSVAGLGYTAAGTGTIGSITSASGVCGVDYAALATVTVEDVCGVSKNCIIRNTGGQWILKSTTTCGVSGVGTLISDIDNIKSYSYIKDNKRQEQSMSGGGCTGTSGSLCADDCFYSPTRTCAFWCAANTTMSVEQCITPYTNVDTGCINNPSWCCRYTTSAAYYEWEC